MDAHLGSVTMRRRCSDFRRDGYEQALRDTGPFATPLRLDDAGCVANRWCELLPVPVPAKQKLMEREDPA